MPMPSDMGIDILISSYRKRPTRKYRKYEGLAETAKANVAHHDSVSRGCVGVQIATRQI